MFLYNIIYFIRALQPINYFPFQIQQLPTIFLPLLFLPKIKKSSRQLLNKRNLVKLFNQSLLFILQHLLHLDLIVSSNRPIGNILKKKTNKIKLPGLRFHVFSPAIKILFDGVISIGFNKNATRPGRPRCH